MRAPVEELDPSMNFGMFSNGRGVYEVEEEMLALDSRLSPSRFKRLFQREQWKLWVRWHQYHMSVETIRADREALYSAK